MSYVVEIIAVASDGRNGVWDNLHVAIVAVQRFGRIKEGRIERITLGEPEIGVSISTEES